MTENKIWVRFIVGVTLLTYGVFCYLDHLLNPAKSLMDENYLIFRARSRLVNKKPKQDSGIYLAKVI